MNAPSATPARLRQSAIAQHYALSLLKRRDEASWSMLDLHDLHFLSFTNLIHIFYETVGELLQLFSATFQLVLGNFFLFFTFTQFFFNIATNVTYSNFVLIQFLVERLDKLTATIFTHRRNIQANDLTVICRVNT